MIEIGHLKRDERPWSSDLMKSVTELMRGALDAFGYMIDVHAIER